MTLKYPSCSYDLIFLFPILKPPDNATRSLWLPLEENTTPLQHEDAVSADNHNQSEHSTINQVDNIPQYSKCHMYVDGQNHSMGQQSCINGYEFHFEQQNGWNVISEWGLVCNRQ